MAKKTYTRCSDDVAKIVRSLIDQHYPDLRHAKVRIDLLNVADSDGDHALYLRGRACGAIVRKTTTRERAAGRGDAEIVIDREYYLKLTERQRTALLDHELYHLEVLTDRDDTLKLDTNGRPCLGLREHDYEVGWFHDIAERYGEDSGEVMQARKLLQGKLGQIYFGFAAESPALEPMRKLVRDNSDVESVTISSPEHGGVKIDKHGIHAVPPAAEHQEPDAAADIEALLPAALKAIKDLQRASASGVQRRLRIGYNRAHRILEALEALGVVGPERGSEPREILVDLDTYQLPAKTNAAA
jgi:hypothetical protein